MTNGPLAKLMQSMKIETEYWRKPIPIRDHDWSAIDAETYDGNETDPIGYGETEYEAICNLLECYDMQVSEIDAEDR